MLAVDVSRSLHITGFALALVASMVPACRTAVRAEPEPPALGGTEEAPGELRAGLTRGGSYRVVWVPVPDPIPLNEPFELTVVITHVEDGTPVIDATLMVEATMPSHGHGMNRHPRVVDRVEGRYRVAGMLFHMSGLWQIDIDVIRRHVAEGVRFDVDLP
jgi:hypothetical protein